MLGITHRFYEVLIEKIEYDIKERYTTHKGWNIMLKWTKSHSKDY